MRTLYFPNTLPVQVFENFPGGPFIYNIIYESCASSREEGRAVMD